MIQKESQNRPSSVWKVIQMYEEIKMNALKGVMREEERNKYVFAQIIFNISNYAAYDMDRKKHKY